MVILLGSPTYAQRSLNDLSGSWQLLVDDWLVAKKSGVERVWHPFEKHAGNPVLTADRPWEGTVAYLYGTVLPEENGKGYRIWYHSWADNEYRKLYATSRDGLKWEKPDLGQVGYKGLDEEQYVPASHPRGPLAADHSHSSRSRPSETLQTQHV